jgi:addiction module HigA family antidote
MADLIRRDALHRIDLSDVATGEMLANITPGEVLREEFMVPLGLSARALARDLGVPANRITAILHGERAITAETAVLLSERFGTSPEFWLNLQVAFDLEAVRRSRSIQPLHPQDPAVRAIRDHQAHQATDRVAKRARTATNRR